jgi:hypothetical protein
MWIWSFSMWSLFAIQFSPTFVDWFLLVINTVCLDVLLTFNWSHYSSGTFASEIFLLNNFMLWNNFFLFALSPNNIFSFCKCPITCVCSYLMHFGNLHVFIVASLFSHAWIFIKLPNYRPIILAKAVPLLHLIRWKTIIILAERSSIGNGPKK